MCDNLVDKEDYVENYKLENPEDYWGYYEDYETNNSKTKQENSDTKEENLWD